MAVSEERPNVLWICTDQQRYDTIGALGNEVIRTPHLDDLAIKEVAFSRDYSRNPICQLRRASFMTSLYPSTLHINGNSAGAFPENAPVVSGLFAKASYNLRVGRGPPPERCETRC